MTHQATANRRWSLFSRMVSVDSRAFFVFFTDGQTYVRTPRVKIMTTNSAVAWWVNKFICYDFTVTTCKPNPTLFTTSTSDRRKSNEMALNFFWTKKNEKMRMTSRVLEISFSFKKITVVENKKQEAGKTLEKFLSGFCICHNKSSFV